MIEGKIFSQKISCRSNDLGATALIELSNSSNSNELGKGDEEGNSVMALDSVDKSGGLGSNPDGPAKGSTDLEARKEDENGVCEFGFRDRNMNDGNQQQCINLNANVDLKMGIDTKLEETSVGEKDGHDCKALTVNDDTGFTEDTGIQIEVNMDKGIVDAIPRQGFIKHDCMGRDEVVKDAIASGAEVDTQHSTPYDC